MMAHPLSQPPSPRAIREGALALVTAGKPLESVAAVYGMSVQTLCKLLLQPADAAPGETPPPEPAKPWHRFPGTVVYRYGMDGLVVTLATVLLGVSEFGAVQIFGARHAGAALIARWAAAFVACAVALLLAWRSAPVKHFEMRRDAIVRTTRYGRRVLRYVDIVAVWVFPSIRGANAGVTLFTRDGRRMAIAPSLEQMADPAFKAWLDSIPYCGSVMSFTPLSFLRSPGFVVLAVMALMFIVVPLVAVHHLAARHAHGTPSAPAAFRQPRVYAVSAVSGSESSARYFSRAASARRLPASHP